LSHFKSAFFIERENKNKVKMESFVLQLNISKILDDFKLRDLKPKLKIRIKGHYDFSANSPCPVPRAESCVIFNENVGEIILFIHVDNKLDFPYKEVVPFQEGKVVIEFSNRHEYIMFAFLKQVRCILDYKKGKFNWSKILRNRSQNDEYKYSMFALKYINRYFPYDCDIKFNVEYNLDKLIESLF